MSTITSTGASQAAAAASDARLKALLEHDYSGKQTDGFDSLLSALSGGSSNDATSSTTGSNSSLLDLGGIGLGSIGALLGLNDNAGAVSSSSLYPTSLNNRAALEAAIGSDGPLPSFLKEYSSAMKLDAAHTQALYEITANHMDMDRSDAAKQELREALQKAGLQA